MQEVQEVKLLTTLQGVQEIKPLTTLDAQVRQGGNRDPQVLETGSDLINPDQEAQGAHTLGDTRPTDQGHKAITGRKQGTATSGPDLRPGAGILTKLEPEQKHERRH